jgi:hypothetical protein
MWSVAKVAASDRKEIGQFDAISLRAKAQPVLEAFTYGLKPVPFD